MTEPEAPRIEFPCAYPIKVMGEACVEFRDHVHQVMERHAPGFDRATITVRDSRNGRFQACGSGTSAASPMARCSRP